TALVALNSANAEEIQFSKIYHLLEGWAYQAIVRMEMVNHFLPTLNASYYQFNGQDAALNHEMEQRIRQVWTGMMNQSFQHCALETVHVFSPWHRMFEIGIDLTLSYR
ncbi:MAG: DUF4127 family protein, partial [Merismopedia sp. SIO2A8]|nr:DUF4127 family protein [Merismopedia sp. SIO2A8]